jgi:hypothetical protein
MKASRTIAAAALYACGLTTGAGWLEAQTPAPLATCVEYDANNQVMVAHFGVSLPERAAPVTTPIGSDNLVTPPGAVVYGQPTTFIAGTKPHSFLAVLKGPATLATAVTWKLGTLSATVTSVNNACLPNGTACWDRNHSGQCDVDTEDTNGDGLCTLADCLGPRGDVGLRGPMGAAGLQGPSGPRGPQGDPAFPALFRMTSATSPSASAAVSCAPSEKLITGGAVCVVPNRTTNSGRVASSSPSGSNGWSVSCSLGEATAVAVCAAVPGGNQ